MVALNNWRVDSAKGMTRYVPARVTNDLSGDVIESDRLGEVETLLIISRSLITSTNVVDRLGTSPLQISNVSSSWVLWPIWIIWIHWLTWGPWLIRRNRRGGVLQNHDISLSSTVVVVIGSTSWEAIANQSIPLLLKILNRLSS